VHAILEQVERHTKRLQPKFSSKTEFTKSEEVLVQIFGKVATDKLIAAIIERTHAVCTCVIAQSGSLEHISGDEKR
jgi:hypothetical protein